MRTHLTPAEAGTNYTATVGETAEGFRQRAHMEAARYGSDPWVFVRELLQNARDAGAGEVRFRFERSGGFDRFFCRDDGEGMTFEHAREFLFTLYASSKVDDDRAAGRFGIGFWSVLRFNPTKILIRSRPKEGDGWEVTIDGGFRSVRQRTLVMQPGTEIVLERPASEENMAARVTAAVRSEIRGLKRRDDPKTAVRILVDDEVVTFDREPAPPAISVDEPGLHVTVALAEKPRVDVFAHGIRIRTAGFLDELLAEGVSDGPASVEIPDGLLPQVVLDSSRLQVLLARGDARQDRTMSGLVRRAERELANLVRGELDRVDVRSRKRRAWDWIRESGYGWRWLAAIATASLVAAAVIGLERSCVTGRASGSGAVITGEAPGRPAVTDGDPAGSGRLPPYRDVSEGYAGPRVDSLATGTAIDLRYRPEVAEPLFAALRVGGLDDRGHPLPTSIEPVGTPYRGQVCAEDCLEVDLAIEGGPGPVRIPVASGHRIDATTVRLNGEPVSLLELESGEPAVWFDAPGAGRLSYASGAAPAMAPAIVPVWPELPAPLGDAALQLAALAPVERVAAATELVASLVRYDRSAETARRLERARAEGAGPVDAAVAVGAGDCDVQNAVLAALLDRSGLPAWLVVGFVGDGGRVRPGLHAWVEYLDGEAWQVADASGGGEDSPALDAAGPDLAVDEASTRGDGNLGENPTATAGSGYGRGWKSPAPWMLGGAVAIMVLAVVVLMARRRFPARTASADGTVDLSRLLRSALLRPEAFQGVGAIFRRPLVPTLSGRGLSLRAAVGKSRAGGLFRSSGNSEVARRASDRGEAVIDAALPEGAAVADLLGARDLDGWDGIVDRARTNRATEDAEAALHRLGGVWLIRAAADPPKPVSTIEGRLLDLGRRVRLVVLDTSSPLWQAAEPALPERPAWAAFVLGDGIADRLDLEASIRERWLTELARAAVVEGRGGTP